MIEQKIKQLLGELLFNNAALQLRIEQLEKEIEESKVKSDNE